MLDKTLYYQKVWIFETNAYDQNMPLFKGTVQDARQDTDRVWDYLMCEVDHYECANGILDIRVRDEHYSERLAIKAEYASKAKREAAERWGCGADEIRVTGEETYDVTGVPSSTK